MIDLQYYSPEEPLRGALLDEKGISLFMKRDDLIHPFISGNKWRKLKYTLRKALSENKTHLVTFGGAYSNHLLATACASARFGLTSTGFVRGESVDNDTLTLCRMFGMNLIFTDRSSYRDKPALFQNFLYQDPNAFFIDEGGSGPEAVRGCAELVDELSQPYDHIFCASGTGATAAGILTGLAGTRPGTLLHSVPVLKNGGFIKEEIGKYFDDSPIFHVHTDYHFGGYGKTQPELLMFMRDFSEKTGILLDPVYTGKMMFGIYDLIARDHFPAGSKILAIHTGGLLGLLGMTKKISQAIS